MLGGGTAAKGHQAVWLATESTGAVPLDQIVANSVTGSPDVNAAATRNGNEIDILLWNYHDADVPAGPAQVHLSIDGLKGNGAKASEFLMDSTHSNAYRTWQQMGSPAHPTPEQQTQLEQSARLGQAVPDHSIQVQSGNATLNLAIPRQGVVLIRLQTP
jgi:xylan 1,4-beta-xylosidase